MTPEEYLAIPYVLVVESVKSPDGQWFRRAMYPELGISGEALSPLDAIAKLEEARVATILGKLERGEPVPVPRPPLREDVSGLDAQKLGFARWLVDQKRRRTSRRRVLTRRGRGRLRRFAAGKRGDCPLPRS